MHNLYTLAIPTQRTRAFVGEREKLRLVLRQSMHAARGAWLLFSLMLICMFFETTIHGGTPWENPDGFVFTSIIGLLGFIAWGYSMMQFMTIESTAMIENSPIRGWHFMSPRNSKKRKF
jgi:hypothetical protein